MSTPLNPEKNAVSDCSAAQGAASKSRSGDSGIQQNSLQAQDFSLHPNAHSDDFSVSSDKPSSTASSNESRAEEAKDVSIVPSGAIVHREDPGGSESIAQDAELTAIVKAWPGLPAKVRQVIIQLIKVANIQ